MGESNTITAQTTGSPTGVWDDPWPKGHPVEGERVAIFAFDITAVDGSSSRIRTYHVSTPDRACDGPVAPPHTTPQGDTVRWLGFGTGTVVRSAEHMSGEQALMAPDESAEAMFRCQVRPDNPIPSGS
ncbi:hypothetical protein [Nocardia caishijiensis]|uniref:Ig-like domain-containing protein n=1 Tax=Nocardia caishijiensis TaxID=184756 RepID=A0ABQ6YGF3_9NOCA|nr:hypothetical protein [Nocardia caishijiensis]KAF0844845.1 hypothetical protein FNL39_11077 [Nocardia caishijiensis]